MTPRCFKAPIWRRLKQLPGVCGENHPDPESIMNLELGLVHLSYCSQACGPIGSADLDQLLDTSKTNNKRDEITGLLTYSGDLFIQFIEGPKASIDRLMYRLRGDRRHRGLIVLTEGGEHERLLPDWDMELVTPQEAHHLLREALRESDRYGTVIGLTRLLAKLQPDRYQS
ncbi:MAG: BLUF domain-containing protein, partial [Betaproteobacteria bacterium]|nr:BLUF domain-containing protein [Betaproteobacteria bacterium]